MKKFLNVVLCILIVAIIIVTTLIICKYAKNQENEKDIAVVMENIKEKTSKIDNNQEEIKVEYKGYNVLGTIKIDKINIEYPILEYTSNDTLKISITKFFGEKVNQVGNLALAGHNNYDGTMFGKTKYLEIGDTIELTDLFNITRKYSIYKKYVTDPDDTSIIEADEFGTREVTLITCSNGNRERLILKAREITN